jgi:predicted hydrocarbon binding protein
MEYEFDEENGVIYDKVTGDRCIIITKARMHQILSRLSDLFQSGAQVIIREACKAAGERYVAAVPKEAKADRTLFLKTAVQRFTDAGLGKIEVVSFKSETAEIKFRIWNNFFAEIRNEELTYCNCVEAFVSGMYKRITLKTPDIKKTRCIGNGDPYCEWHLTPEK